MKVIVLFKNGFEEVEALGPVDILRRANVECVMVGMDDLMVESSRKIKVGMDQLFDENCYDADAVILPGGQPGANSLRDDDRVIDLLKKFNEDHKLICAICAGPLAFERAGVVKGKKFTCFPGCETQIPSGVHQDTLVYTDDNIVTGRGPAAALMFGYTILEKLGIDSADLQKAMQYPYINQ